MHKRIIAKKPELETFEHFPANGPGYGEIILFKVGEIVFPEATDINTSPGFGEGGNGRRGLFELPFMGFKKYTGVLVVAVFYSQAVTENDPFTVEFLIGEQAVFYPGRCKESCIEVLKLVRAESTIPTHAPMFSQFPPVIKKETRAVTVDLHIFGVRYLDGLPVNGTIDRKGGQSFLRFP